MALVPYDIERITRDNSDSQLAMKGAACALTAAEWALESLGPNEINLWQRSVDALTLERDPRLLENSAGLRSPIAQARAAGSRHIERYHALLLLDTIVRAAATFKREDCIWVCVRSADMAESNGEAGDVEWLEAVWKEVIG